MTLPLCILVLDQSPDIRKLLATLLSRKGYEVVRGEGEQALDCCAELGIGIDLVIAESPIQPPRDLSVLVLRKPFRYAELLQEVQELAG